MTVTATEKVMKAKIQLILSQPFFATLMLSMKVVPDDSIKKAATNGAEIKYNPAFVDTLTVEETKGLLCSAIMKVANLHHLRRGGRAQEEWNKASEFAVNPIVKESGLKLPKESLLSSEYEGMPAEQIFKLLQGKKPDDNGQPQPQQGGNQQQQGQGQGQGDGQGQDDSGAVEVQDMPVKSEAERQEQEAKTKQKVAQAAQVGKRAGKMTDSLMGLVGEILEPKVNWKEVLARFVTDTARNDYSFKQPNSRFIHTGFYLPTLYNEEAGKIVFIVDTSCSVDDELFGQFGGELQDVCSEIKSMLTVIHVDTKVQYIQEVEPDEKVDCTPRGRGGTDFAPGFEYIEEHGIEAKAIIYLTDGECHSYPDNEPDAPVLWVQYGGYKRFKPPFGEIVALD